MNIKKLQIQNFRNLKQLEFNCHPKFNLFFGANGSGKSSLLEAIYFLSHGRSFRSKQLNRIIRHGQQEFVLFAQVHDSIEHHIGMSRSMAGDNKTRLDARNLSSSVEIAKLLPVLLFEPESFNLLTLGSKSRRQLLDWGVFYQKSDYLPIWQAAKTAHKQRNAALKARLNPTQIELWNAPFIEACEKMDHYRAQYIEELIEVLTSLIAPFIEEHQLQIHYYRGWPKDESLASCLVRSMEQDLRHGLTHYGQHRADIKFRVQHQPAEEVLSRGQQKTLVCALKLAQGLLFQQQTQKACIYLLDDIASELDHSNLSMLMQHFQNQGSQVFITSLQQSALIKHLSSNQYHCYELDQGLLKKAHISQQNNAFSDRIQTGLI